MLQSATLNVLQCFLEVVKQMLHCLRSSAYCVVMVHLARFLRPDPSISKLEIDQILERLFVCAAFPARVDSYQINGCGSR